MSDVLDYELDDTIDIDTPERKRAVADPVRSLIMDLVLERALSVTDLAGRIGKSKGTIAHHVDVLVECGLLKVVRVRKVRAMEERFYGRVARTMMFGDHGDRSDLPFFQEARNEIDLELIDRGEIPGTWTLRHARIPLDRAEEWARRLDELALEFIREPRGGDIEFAVLLGMFPTNRKVAPPKKSPPKKTPSKKAATKTSTP